MANDKSKNKSSAKSDKPVKKDMSKKKEMYLKEPTDKEVAGFAKRFRLPKSKARKMMNDKVEKLRKAIEDYENA